MLGQEETNVGEEIIVVNGDCISLSLSVFPPPQMGAGVSKAEKGHSNSRVVYLLLSCSLPFRHILTNLLPDSKN